MNDNLLSEQWIEVQQRLIRELRSRAALSDLKDYEVAEKLGIGRAYFSGLRNGKRSMGIPLAEKVAESMGMELKITLVEKE